MSVVEALAPPVLDHVVINVKDRLDPAQDAYERLGFQLTERGHHSLGSANHLAIFDTNYLELLGYEPGKEGSRADLWAHPIGLTGLVFKGTAPEARYEDLKSRGVPVEPPAEFTRPVDLPGGAQDAKFRVLRISPGEVQNGRTFFCYHFTPDLVWREEWQGHPNTVTSVREFIIASKDPARTAALYDRMFGPDLLQKVEGGVVFPAGAAKVAVLAPEAITARFGQPVELGPDGSDRMVALVFATASLDAAQNVFKANGIEALPFGAAGLVVSADQGMGVITAFVKEEA